VRGGIGAGVLALFALAATAPSVAGAAGASADEWLRQARNATDSRDYVAALAAYQRLLAVRADDVDLLIEAARVHGYADRNAESAALYRRALALAPARRGDIVPSLAWQSLWAGEAALAIELFAERVAQQGPGQADALDGLGQARQAAGDHVGALAAYRAAHALAPDQLRLHRRLAMSLLWNGRENEAIAELSALLRRAPGDRDLAWALANARNFAGLHRQALSDFLRLPAPSHPGERADLARAWRWAGYEEQAWPLLVEPVDAEAAWLRDWRVRRELAPFGYTTLERAQDRDALLARAWVIGAGWHPAPGATVDLQVRRLALDDPAGEARATQLQASVRWRLGQATASTGTLWPSVAMRVHHFAGWSPVTPTARLLWIPQDRWRVDAEATRELVETPRAVAGRVTVDVLSIGAEHRPDTPWLWAGAGAVLRFDDGSTRLRVNGRVEHTVLSRPRLVAGLEALAFERVHDGSVGDRGYWNPRRYAQARAYGTLTHDMRPFDLFARIGWGVAREVDADGNRSHGRPHLWELGLGWDLARDLRLRLAMGGSGQGMGVSGGGAGYWRRYVNLSANAWF
jgi:tetratricopeptide (TPR) repeat protein